MLTIALTIAGTTLPHHLFSPHPILSSLLTIALTIAGTTLPHHLFSPHPILSSLLTIALTIAGTTLFFSPHPILTPIWRAEHVDERISTPLNGYHNSQLP